MKKKILLVLALLPISLYCMMNYFFSDSSVQLPPNAQKILDKNNRLIAYHIRKNIKNEDETRTIQLDLYNLSQLLLATYRYGPKIHTINFNTITDRREIELATEWRDAIQQLLPYERTPSEKIWYLRNSFEKLNPAHQTDKLILLDQPIVLNWEYGVVSLLWKKIKLLITQ